MKPEQSPILRKAFEAQANDSHGFALGMHGGYRNPAVARDWKWFVNGAAVAVPALVDNQRKLLDMLQRLCDVQGIEALALPAVLDARALIASATDPLSQGAAHRRAGGRRMDNPYWRKGLPDSDDCKAWDAGYSAEAEAIRPRCDVRGSVVPGAMCGKSMTGGRCGSQEPCQHKREA